jgi:hypothetical protein
MANFAIELNDRALSIARDGIVLSSVPSAVFDGSSLQPAGSAAWAELRRQPTAISTRHLGAVSSHGERSDRSLTLLNAELARHLADHNPAAGERVWIAAPARVNPNGLGDVLSLLRAQGLTVDGFVDSAAVSVAALSPGRNALVLELGLHHLAATAVDSTNQTRRRRAVISDRGGLMELYEAWLDLISAAMVKRTRFDPLHNAVSEQQLFDALPSLAEDAAASGSATASVTVRNERFDVALSRDQFTEAAQPIYREILRLLHALRPAGAAVTLLMPQVVVQFPGLRELLESFVGCELIALPDGFAAAATSTLDLPHSTDEQAVRLLRRLPSSVHPKMAALGARELLGQQRASGPMPSHVLFEGKAYSLADVLVVGRAPDSPQSIRLPEGLAGVSRRHFTFVREAGELVLVDHSSFGTLVNGERVSERVRVHGGDKVRIGDPGIEFSLLSLAESQV